MIRINLLPVKAQRRRTLALYQMLGMAALVIATLLASVAAAMHYSSEADKRVKIAEEQDKQISDLKNQLGEVNDLQKNKDKLDEQLGVIDKLEKGKRGPVRLLDEFTTIIPKQVTLTSFRESAGAVSISGTAADNTEVSEFLKGLQKSKYLSDVQLKFSQSDVRAGKTQYNFEITCRVNYAA